MFQAHCSGSSDSGTYDGNGSHRRYAQTTIRSSSPRMNTGVPVPARVSTVRARSVTPPRRSADSSPVPTPMTSQITIAPSARERVAGTRSRISWVTCWSVLYEKPRQGASQCSTAVPVE